MKKVFVSFILGVLILSSCSVSLPTPKSTVFVIDYSALTQKGIFVTESNSVSFDYEAIGSVVAEETDGWVKQSLLKDKEKQPRKVYQDEYYDDSQYSSRGKNVFIPADLNAALQNLGEQLIEIGANGIINLKIEYVKVPYVKSSLNSIIVSGMAIKK